LRRISVPRTRERRKEKTKPSREEEVMSLKKATGNMYSWITHTWNPVRGECPYQCSYCYVGRRGEQKPLHLDGKELRTNLGAGNFIFVCSGCDLFHPAVPDDWIERILDRTLQFPKNRYLWHTKNPARFLNRQFSFRENDVLCVTIESDIWYPVGKAPAPVTRFIEMDKVQGLKMITIEPVMDFDLELFSKCRGFPKTSVLGKPP
jgi:protein gp37